MCKHLLLSLLLLSVAVVSIHLGNHDQSIPVSGPGNSNINLIADNGNYLTICTNCGGKSPNNDAAAIKPKNDSPSQVWYLQRVKNQVALKGSNGLYLSRCNHCLPFAPYQNYAFANSRELIASSLWTLEPQSNGKYALKADNGEYLARCEGCISGEWSTVAYINGRFPYSKGSLWTINYLSTPNTSSKTGFAPTIMPKVGIVKIIADNGNYLNICKFCIFSPGAVVVQFGSLSASDWKLEVIGNKITLLGSNMNYLSRCTKCFTKSQSKPDAAFANKMSSTEEATRWTPVPMANGTWAFRGDNGMYLNRCSNCVLGDFKDYAFVSSPHPVAWTLKYNP